MNVRLTMNYKFEYFDKMYEVTKSTSKSGPPSIGICTSEGVALVALKVRKSKLMILENMERIFMIDNHIGCVLSGLIPDGRVLINQARVQCQNHKCNYKEDMPVRSCVRTVSAKASEFANVKDSTLGRPYAVKMLFAGISDGMPQLWHMDSSGAYKTYGTKSIGMINEIQWVKTLRTDVKTQQKNLDNAVSTAIRNLAINLEWDDLEVLILKPKQKGYILPGSEIVKRI